MVKIIAVAVKQKEPWIVAESLLSFLFFFFVCVSYAGRVYCGVGGFAQLVWFTLTNERLMMGRRSGRAELNDT